MTDPNHLLFDDEHPRPGMDPRRGANLARRDLPLRCLSAHSEDMACQVASAQLCGNPVGEIKTVSAVVRFANGALDEDHAAHGSVLLFWQLAGRSGLHQGRNSSTLDAGAWSVLDGRRDYDIEFEPGAHGLFFWLSREQCGCGLTAADSLAALALSSQGAAHIAKAMLLSLLHERANLDRPSAHSMQALVVDLFESALSAEMRQRGISVQFRPSITASRVQAYVHDHLNDHTLSVDKVASVFGMSRRSLYNLFAPIGVTPHAFIQSAKLDRAKSLLCDPGWRESSIVHIAEHCGFANAAHFSRAFRARHGNAPNAWRRRSA